MFMATFQDDYNPNILDQWIAVDKTVSPGKSTQFVLGYEEYIKDIYKLQIEGYYKDIENFFYSSNDIAAAPTIPESSP